MKLDNEPRLQGEGPSMIDWARKVAASVNALYDQLAGYFTNGVLKVANGGTGNAGGAWTVVNGLLVSAQTGTLADATTQMLYQKVGRLVTFNCYVTITTNGTGGGLIKVVLPWLARTTAIFVGREVQTTGNQCQAFVFGGTDVCYIATYSNGYPGGTGYVIAFSGTYEATT